MTLHAMNELVGQAVTIREWTHEDGRKVRLYCLCMPLQQVYWLLLLLLMWHGSLESGTGWVAAVGVKCLMPPFFCSCLPPVDELWMWLAVVTSAARLLHIPAHLSFCPAGRRGR